MISLLIRTILLFFISLSALMGHSTYAASYPQKINFQNLIKNQDIALGEVEVTIQDHQGYIWLGGRNALLRYDGYDFLPVKTFTGKEPPNTFEEVNQVVTLLEDTHHHLWVGTRSGLLKYDREKNVLHKLKAQNGKKVSIYTTTVNCLVEAPTGELLVGAYEGLSIVDRN